MKAIEVTIEIRGKQYPCRMTMGAMLDFKRKTGMDVSELGNMEASSEERLELMMTLIWCCINSACRCDGIAFDIPLDTFADHISPEDFAAGVASMTQGETEGN